MVNTKDIVDILGGRTPVFRACKGDCGASRRLFPEDQHDRRLLIDIKGKMSLDSRHFPPPSDEASGTDFPNGRMRDLSIQSFGQGLLAEASGNVVRDKIHSLKGYGFVEYSAEAMSQHFAAEQPTF